MSVNPYVDGQFPPNPFPNPFCNWPDHMYDNNNHETGVLCCQVKDCHHRFDRTQLTMTPLKHYTDASLDPSLSELSRNEHGLMRQLHTLGLCLFCGPGQPSRYIRSVLFHISYEHQTEPAVTTIPGFLTWVRKYPQNFPWLNQGDRAYRNTTLRLAYEHMRLKLTSDHLNEHRAIMGWTTVPAENVFRWHLTNQKEEGIPRGDYWPWHPNSLLIDLHHNQTKTWLSKQVWDHEVYKLQELYRKGEI